MPLVLRVTSENRTLFGNRQVKKFEACGGTIGRSKKNDWVFPDPHRYVSGRHALIDFQSGAYYVVDTSRNGVYVNDADAPISGGHPQRLFDGDVLRIGNYEILVELTAEEAEATNDAINDSVVRAQLVGEDESVEMQMVDEKRIVDEEPFDRYLQENSSPHTQLSEQIPALRAMPGARPGGKSGPETKSAVALILKSAGLKPNDLAARDPAEILHTVGQLLRHLVIGLTGLLEERAQAKEALQLEHTAIQSHRNNPLRISTSPEDALKYLLGDSGESGASSIDLIRTSFEEVSNHEHAMPRALSHALKLFLEHFAPDELRQQFDFGLPRNRLFGTVANKLKYWELYEDTFTELTRGEAGKLPEAFSREFARAYAEEVETLKSGRTE